MVKNYVAEIKHTFRFYPNTPFIIGVIDELFLHKQLVILTKRF